jgi:intraflagellar transport protein 20
MALPDRIISIDDQYLIRVLDAEKFEEAKNLKDQCAQFLDSRINQLVLPCTLIFLESSQFVISVNSFTSIMTEKAKQIESEKMNAIGYRNRVVGEKEERKRKQTETQALIIEKQAELERFQKQLDSVQRLELEQKNLLERLANNEF